MKIKLVDNAFYGQPFTNPTWIGNSPIEWDRSEPTDTDDVVIYTDDRIWEDKKGKIKIAWLFEGEEFKPLNYDYIRKNHHEFDYVFTWKKSLIDINPNKFIFVPYGGSWIEEHEESIYEKDKLVSIVASSKNFLTGHKLRHDVISKFKDSNLDVFGYGYNPVQSLLTAYKDYKFTIVIENIKDDYGFSEKIITPILCGTIPIYYGTPSINSFFEKIITFNTLEELEKILSDEKWLDQYYDNNLQYVKRNFQIAQQYRLMENSVIQFLNKIGLKE